MGDSCKWLADSFKWLADSYNLFIIHYLKENKGEILALLLRFFCLKNSRIQQPHFGEKTCATSHIRGLWSPAAHC